MTTKCQSTLSWLTLDPLSAENVMAPHMTQIILLQFQPTCSGMQITMPGVWSFLSFFFFIKGIFNDQISNSASIKTSEKYTTPFGYSKTAPADVSHTRRQERASDGGLTHPMVPVPAKCVPQCSLSFLSSQSIMYRHDECVYHIKMPQGPHRINV